MKLLASYALFLIGNSGLLAAIEPISAFADTFPTYQTRTRPYDGWTTGVRGDLRTVGMSGATLGLAETFIASLSNPAGLAMTLNGADVNFATNTTYDGVIQPTAIQSYSLGIAL